MTQPSEPGDEVRPPPRLLATWGLLGLAFASVLILLSVRCALGPKTAPAYASRTLPAEPEPTLLSSSLPGDDYYPCSDCHEDEPTDRTVRVLEDDHEDLELAHGDLWCLACHDTVDRDQLQLADRNLVGFDETWRLCTQCHGNKLAAWRAGVHGKRMGHWWGPKEYWTCTACHDPHAPAFSPIEPKPPPVRPSRLSRSGTSHPLEDPHE